MCALKLNHIYNVANEFTNLKHSCSKTGQNCFLCNFRIFLNVSMKREEITMKIRATAVASGVKFIFIADIT